MRNLLCYDVAVRYIHSLPEDSMYKCKRYGCTKTAQTRSGLRCPRCDTAEAQEAGTQVIYSTPPASFETAEVSSSGVGDSGSSSGYSGGGGDFGGGGASGDY